MNTNFTCVKAAYTLILYFQISHIECKSNKLEHILHKSSAKIYAVCVNLTFNLTTNYTFLHKKSIWIYTEGVNFTILRKQKTNITQSLCHSVFKVANKLLKCFKSIYQLSVDHQLLPLFWVKLKDFTSCFPKNLRSWQDFYATAGPSSPAKYYLWFRVG